MKNKKAMISVIGVIVFLLTIFSFLFYYDYQKKNYREIGESYLNANHMSMQEMHRLMMQSSEEKSMESLVYLIPIVGLIGILIGIAVYYFMDEKVEEREEMLKENTEIILKLLNQEEREVIKKLLENKGEMRQYELSYIAGLNKVKTHRVIRALEKKGIISKERFGKVNKIKLNSELYEVLKGKNEKV